MAAWTPRRHSRRWCGPGRAAPRARRRDLGGRRSLHVDPGAGWFPHFVGFADALGKPSVLVHEGGYELARLGVDTVAVLRGFGEGAS